MPPSDSWNGEEADVKNEDGDVPKALSATQRSLLELFVDVLGVTPLGIHDDFFELGGDSLMALRLFERIDEVLGKKLPASVLFDAPTIDRLATLVEGQPTSPRTLVPIQTHGSKRPFFCVPGLDDEVLALGPLSRHLGGDQPFYALHARELQATASAPIPIATLAAHYVATVRSVDPGPILIGGYSGGGRVAFEMARVLAMDGQQAALVALFDSSWTVRAQTIAIRRLFDYAKEHQLTLDDRLRLMRTVQAHRRHIPRPYSGRVDLFRVQDTQDEPDLGWRRFAPDLHIHHVPGDHLSALREPHVRHLADRLKVVIENLQLATAAHDTPQLPANGGEPQ